MNPSVKKKKFSLILTAALISALSSCATRDPADEVFARVTASFVYDSLALSPIRATAVGYHVHLEGADEEGKGGTEIRLDGLLDDYSQAAIAKRLNFYKQFRKNLRAQVDRNELAGDEWVDYAVIENHIDNELLEFEKIRSHEHNPTLYVELLGMALYRPLVHEYASKEERYRHILARLEKTPAFLDQAKQNLRSSPEVWTSVAREENRGNINLVEKVIPVSLPDSLRADYSAVSKTALGALRDFDRFLADDLVRRNTYDWRLRPDLYAEKFKVRLTTTKSPETVLSEAEQQLKSVRNDIVEVAKGIHREIYGNQRPPTERALMADVLDVVQDENRLRRGNQMIGQIKKDLAELRTFTNEAKLSPLPSGENLQIVETPEFMRGVYSVAGIMGAPALHPQLGAFYWVTPIPSDWSRSRVNSKLREYNLFALKLLSVHEAIPGHYVQLEWANRIEPESRRLLRVAYANDSYVEGWATYVTEALMDVGYRSDSNELRLVWYKHLLRVIANTILDIRMHTKNMSDDEALELLRRQAFQEAEEARGKLLRAKLTSVQLPLYYVGWRDWLRVRDHYQEETQDFSLVSFHDKALSVGPVPLVPELGYAVTSRPMPK